MASEGGGLAITLDCAETFLIGRDPRVTKCSPHDRALKKYCGKFVSFVVNLCHLNGENGAF